MSMDEHDIGWRCVCGHTNPDFDDKCNGCSAERYSEPVPEFKRGDKVRRIDEPSVVLHVREVDVYGRLDGTGKVLCSNSYGRGKWIAISELERVA